MFSIQTKSKIHGVLPRSPCELLQHHLAWLSDMCTLCCDHPAPCPSGALAWIPTCVPLRRPWGEPRASYHKPVLHSLMGSILPFFQYRELGISCGLHHDPWPIPHNVYDFVSVVLSISFSGLGHSPAHSQPFTELVGGKQRHQLFPQARHRSHPGERVSFSHTL